MSQSEKVQNSFTKSKNKKTISKKEKMALVLALLIFLGSLIGWSLNHYFKSTKTVPDYGGEYTEGYVGKILYINPLLSQSNEIDAVLTDLIFSSLFKYDSQANITEDLVEKYEVKEDGKVYELKLKENIKWHDGAQFTAKDVVFTVDLIKNPAFRSSLRSAFETEEGEIEVEMQDDYSLKFILKEPYTPFLNNLTFGILPAHLFKDISPDNFLLNDLNIKPVGTGPFVFYDLEKDSRDNIISYQLIANENYYGERPYFEKLKMNFYSNEDELIEDYNNKEINGFGLTSYDKISQFEEKKDTRILKIRIPRYFAVFLNEKKSVPLADEKVRQALSLATNKNEIIEKIFHGYAEKINSPILNNFGKIQVNVGEDNYNPGEAKKLLEENGWEKVENSEFRKKDEEELKVNIITTQWPALEKAAEIIKNQWQAVGAKVETSSVGVNEFQQNYIRPRDYEAVLFGQEYKGNSPDAYTFWHSGKQKDPGKNIALYENEEVDEILEKIRKTSDQGEIQKLYQEFTEKLKKDYPAIFLFSPNYVYITNKKIKGITEEAIVNLALHLSEVSSWHINTKRIKK